MAPVARTLDDGIDDFSESSLVEALLALERTRPPPAPIGTRRRVLARIRAWLQQSAPA